MPGPICRCPCGAVAMHKKWILAFDAVVNDESNSLQRKGNILGKKVANGVVSGANNIINSIAMEMN